MKKYVLLILLSITLQYNVLSVDDLIDKLNKDTFNESQAKNIISNLAEFFKETYPFESVAKNPPQPSFNSNYFEKVDIYQELINYNIKEILYQNINYIMIFLQ